MKKIDSKQIMYYVLLVGVLALVIVYFLVFKKYNDLTEQLNVENRNLSNRVTTLKEYYDNRQMYEASINAMVDDINYKLDEFPADVKEEDILMLAVDTMKYSVVAYTGINITGREPVYTIDRSVVGPAEVEGLSDTITFVKRTANYVNTVDYYNLKQVVGQILTSPYSRNISVISYTANEGNSETSEDAEADSEIEMLDGTISVQFYTVLGAGKPYIRPEIPDYAAGLYNIFGFKTETVKENDL